VRLEEQMANGLTRRRVLATGATLTAAAIPGMFAIAPSANAEEQIESLSWELPSFPETLFIPNAWTVYTGAIMSLVQEGLLTFGYDLALKPALADKEQVDPTTFKYHLRSGVKFGDGSPLTAEDVVATFTYHMRPESGSQLASFYTSVKVVEATAADEVTVILKEPNVEFAYTAAHMAGFVFKKEQLADKNIGTRAVLPLGTGPYRLVEFVPEVQVILEARDDYWGGKPVVRRIILLRIKDPQSRRYAMQSGAIDGAFDLSLSEADQWKKTLTNVQIVTAPSLGVYALTLDHSDPPFDDIHFRRAVAYAVDREGLVNALLKGDENGEAATALNPPEMWSGVLPIKEVREFYATLSPSYSFDLTKAKAELAKSRYPDGYNKTIIIPASNTDPYMLNILQSVVEKLGQIGIRATINLMDNNAWLAQYFQHEDLSTGKKHPLGMQIMAYSPDYPGVGNYPMLFFSSANAVNDGMNGSNFKNAEVDELLKTANEKTNSEARAVALKKVFQIANEDVALVSIFWPHSAMAINSKYKLTGYTAFWYSVPWALGLRRK
jgi:peptide/nickel transport system substrate-binding protein